MAELTKLEFLTLPRLLAVGKVISVTMSRTMSSENPLGPFWDKCFAENIFEPLEAMAEHVYSPDYVGWMGNFDMASGRFDYVVGMLMKPGCPVPDGYDSFGFGPCEAVVGWIRGAGAADVCSEAHPLTEKAACAAGRSCARAEWSMELYNCPRFTAPDGDGLVTLDYYIPCGK